MGAIVNFVMRLSGFGKAIEALDGETSKTYGAGVGKILTGAAEILGGVATLASQFVAAKGGANYLALVQDIPHGLAAAAIVHGWNAILDGRAVIAQRHAVAKAIVAAPEAPKP